MEQPVSRRGVAVLHTLMGVCALCQPQPSELCPALWKVTSHFPMPWFGNDLAWEERAPYFCGRQSSHDLVMGCRLLAG